MGYPIDSDRVFKALADPTRRDILVALRDKPMPVHSITERFAVSRPAISKHLRILSEAGLVTPVRTGKENHYALEAAALDEVLDWLSRMWLGRLELLKRLAERAN